MDQIIIELTDGFTFGQEVIKEIKLRKPNVVDLNALGYPVRVETDGIFNIIPDVCFKYLVRLSGMPKSALETMSLVDASAAYAKFVDFFMKVSGFSR